MESLTAQGVSLSDVLKQTENLRARGVQVEENGDRPAKPTVEPPPNMAVLSDLAGFNEMKK